MFPPDRQIFAAPQVATPQPKDAHKQLYLLCSISALGIVIIILNLSKYVLTIKLG
jgi:hypothetical protein